MKELARRTGRTVSVNLNQPDDAPDLWRDVLGLLDEASDEGLSIVAQVAGRVVGLLMCLEGSFNPLAFHPAYQEIASLSLAERSARLADPELRDAFAMAPAEGGDLYQRLVLDRLGSFWAVEDGDIDYEPPADASLAAVAERTGRRATDLMIDHLATNGGNGIVLTPFFNYAYGDLSFTYEVHQHPGTRMGLADAGAHCGVVCDGGTPTFMLTHWTRDRTRGPKLALEHVVRRQTKDTAELYGLGDRGALEPGLRADINVIDYERSQFGRAADGPRPPGRRPTPRPEGQGVRGNVRGRRADRRPRRIHRRTARQAPAGPARCPR